MGETAIESANDAIAKLAEEIAALKAGIKALDKMVVEATEQRKEENEDFKELMASDTAAKEPLKFAKNRLNKFYNPKLYKAPPKAELSREDRIAVNMGGTAPPTAAPGGIAGTGIAVLAEVTSHDHDTVAPPPPPESFGAYQKKSEDGMGVMAMMDLLLADLDKEMTEAETTEKDAQADYEGAFLQTDAAQILRGIASSKKDALMDDDRQELMAFLSNTQGTDYAPQSGQITGILKTMGDEMAAGLAEATKAEEAAIAIYEKLMAAKKKEVIALTKEIETKLTRIGDLGVEIAEMKNDLGDTQEALVADKKFLANLEENCEKKKKKEWEVVVKTRAQELAALADTIKVL